MWGKAAIAGVGASAQGKLPDETPLSLAHTALTAALDGSEVRTIAQFDAGYHRYPRWSPDGRWIAFERGDGLRFDLFVASARRLGKGPERPLNNEQDRAAMLAALDSVTLVTWFDEDTPVQLLDELRPAIYVKGGDYAMETLAETRLVQGWGGRALAIPLVGGYSTTSLVRK